MTKYQPGRYKGRVTNWGLTKTKTDKDQFYLVFDVLGRVDPKDVDGPLIPVSDGTRTYYKVITDKTIKWLLDDLKYLGYNRSSFRFLDPQVENAHSFYDLEIDVACDHEEYEGEMKERWSLRYDSDFAAEPLEPQRVRKLDAMFGKQLKEIAEPEPPTEYDTHEVEQPVTASNDDNIPF